MKLATTGDFGRYFPEHTDRIKAVADAGVKYIDFILESYDLFNN